MLQALLIPQVMTPPPPPNIENTQRNLRKYTFSGGLEVDDGERNFKAVVCDGTCIILVGKQTIQRGNKENKVGNGFKLKLCGETNFLCNSSFYFGGAVFQRSRYWWGCALTYFCFAKSLDHRSSRENITSQSIVIEQKGPSIRSKKR